MGKKIFLILAMTILAACETKVTPSATPFVVQNFATVPELENMVAQWLTDFNAEQARGTLHLEILSRDQIISAINSGNVALAILGEEPPADWFVTPLVREAIVVIVNPEISPQSLSLPDLKEIFSGRIGSWETRANDDDSIQVVIPMKGNVFRDRFEQVIMKDSVFDPSSLLVNAPVDMQELIRSNEGAIGFLPASQLEDGVDIVKVDENIPGVSEAKDKQYPLWVDIVASSPQEPDGALRNFLVWLQGRYLGVQ